MAWKPTFLNVMAYGYPGAGKTTFGATFPNPVLIEFERGEGVLWQAKKDVPILRPHSEEDVWSIVDEPIKTVEKYHPGYAPETFVFDTVSVMQDFFMETALRRKRTVPDSSRPDQQDFGANFRSMVGFFKVLRKMPFHTVCLAHAEIVEDKSTGAREGWPMLFGQLRQRSMALCDIVLYLTAPDGPKGAFVAHSKNYMKFNARSRYDTPARIENPTFNALIPKERT